MTERLMIGVVVFVFVISGVIFWCHRQMMADYNRMEKELNEYHEKERNKKPNEPKKALSLAFLNRNPLNVKAVEGGWEGQVGVDGQGHAIFKS